MDPPVSVHQNSHVAFVILVSTSYYYITKNNNNHDLVIALKIQPPSPYLVDSAYIVNLYIANRYAEKQKFATNLFG